MQVGLLVVIQYDGKASTNHILETVAPLPRPDQNYASFNEHMTNMEGFCAVEC